MLLVRDAMKKNVITTSPSTTLAEAAKTMEKYRIGSIVVVEKDRIAGIFTDRDMRKCVSNNCNTYETTIGELMTKDVIVVEESKDLIDAIELMKKHGVKKLPVVRGGILVGIITTSDITVVAPEVLKAISDLISFEPDKKAAG